VPSKSPAQKRLMAAVAHGWKPDQIMGPPVAVAKEFNDADELKKKKRKTALTIAVLRALGG
jgi:membrane-bound lytic murein transglycosylase B